MDKLKIAALFAAGAVTGSLGVRIAAADEPVPTVTVKTIQVFRSAELPDGGWQWAGRVCAAESLPDGGFTEPCWGLEFNEAELATLIEQSRIQKSQPRSVKP